MESDSPTDVVQTTSQTLSQLMISSKYSDLTLLCQGRQFLVHKAVMCTRSPVIAAACDGAFQESTTGTIQIDEFDAATVERMVHFVYTGDYEVGGKSTGSSDLESRRQLNVDTSTSPSPQRNTSGLNRRKLLDTAASTGVSCGKTTSQTSAETLLYHVQVNAIADYYDLQELRRLANKRIQRALSSSYTIAAVPDVLQVAFGSTSDDALHRMMSSIVAERIEDLVELKQFGELDILSDFALGVMRAMIAVRKEREAKAVNKLQFTQNRLKETEERLRSAEVECSTLNSMLEQEVDTAQQASDSMESFRAVFNRTDGCNNVPCEAEFECYIERSVQTGVPHFTLRCGRCRCTQK